MSEIKNYDNVVEVILGDTAYLLLKNSSFKDNKIIDFPISFLTGDFKDVNNYTIKLPKEIYGEDIIINYKDKISKLINLIDNNYIVRVWTSHYDTDDYLLLLFISSYLKDRVDNIIVLYSDDYKKECYSPCTMTSKELDKLSTYEHILSKEEINKLSEEWDRIKKENSDLRIIQDGKVVSINYDYFNDEIITILNKKGSTSVMDIIYELMVKYHLYDRVFKFLINKLIESGKIKIIESNERFIKNIVTISK